MHNLDPSQQQVEKYSNKPIAGALYMLGSALVFAMLGALVKTLSQSLSNEMVVFFRNVFALIFIIPWVWYRKPVGGIKTSKYHLHMLRSAAGLGAMYCYFYALAHMKLGEAVLLNYTTPLFIPIIAYVWIKESVPRKVIAAVIIGFAGIILILKPGSGLFDPVAIIALTAGILASFSFVTIRRMAPTEPPVRIVFYYTLLATVFSCVPLLWAWQTPGTTLWWILILTGLVAVSGQLLMTKSYNLAPAAQVSPFMYAIVVFATIMGFLFWGESLDILSLGGALLVCLAGIMATLHFQKTQNP
ncbi:MAG: DMT family transporter [Deltaproteobacteria bacterium]|nr:DMT family transporter [Deltaproteobacteria bacterium]